MRLSQNKLSDEQSLVTDQSNNSTVNPNLKNFGTKMIDVNGI
jgi:hypothetical protein